MESHTTTYFLFATPQNAPLCTVVGRGGLWFLKNTSSSDNAGWNRAVLVFNAMISSVVSANTIAKSTAPNPILGCQQITKPVQVTAVEPNLV